MSKGRMEAYSDAVIAIIMTIMVLELRPPEGTDWAALQPLVPVFLVYALSFVYLGIYWNNHHHLLQATTHITGGILWANLNLLFWLSLFPFATGWMGENHAATVPTIAYGIVLLLAGVAYYILQSVILRSEGPNSALATALGRDLKGKSSPVIYVVAILMAFVNPYISLALYVVVAAMWLIPDRRIERLLSTS
ncbi:MAG: TMEM175 family protein [Actinomycetes bacterium]